jgi:ABC-type antimicrobial peptide transport system permease subunit
MAQRPQRELAIVMRTPGDPARLTRPARAALAAIDPHQPVYGALTLRQIRSDKVIGLRYAASLMGGFAALGLLLSAVGVYGLMAYAVSQRTREIGVRIALGARARDVLLETLGQAARVTGAGLGVGAVLAYLLGRFMERALFGSVRLEPGTFLVVGLVLAAVAIAASVFPARRAARVDPIVALRAE